MCFIFKSWWRGQALSVLAIKNASNRFVVVDINGYHPSNFPKHIAVNAERRANSGVDRFKVDIPVPVVTEEQSPLSDDDLLSDFALA